MLEAPSVARLAVRGQRWGRRRYRRRGRPSVAVQEVTEPAEAAERVIKCVAAEAARLALRIIVAVLLAGLEARGAATFGQPTTISDPPVPRGWFPVDSPVPGYAKVPIPVSVASVDVSRHFHSDVFQRPFVVARQRRPARRQLFRHQDQESDGPLPPGSNEPPASRFYSHSKPLPFRRRPVGRSAPGVTDNRRRIRIGCQGAALCRDTGTARSDEDRGVPPNDVSGAQVARLQTESQGLVRARGPVGW